MEIKEKVVEQYKTLTNDTIDVFNTIMLITSHQYFQVKFCEQITCLSLNI